MNPDLVNPNHRAIHPRDDRETLSALFDGELPSDAARFALKRLDHDVSWRETCGRWQLIGDALRGQATTMAPSDFATGVMRALSAEGAAVAVGTESPDIAHSPVRVAPRYRWVGGAALAASVAMAAVLWVRPSSQDAMSDTQVAASAAAPTATSQRAEVAQAATASTSAPSGTVPAETSPSVDLTGSAAVAVAAASRPAVARRGGSNPRGGQRLPQDQSAVAASSNAVAAEVAAATPAGTPQPFHPPAFQPPGDEIATRPWPRAVLPEAGAGSLTVGFGTSTATVPSPSFYPFEPRQPASETQPTSDQR